MNKCILVNGIPVTFNPNQPPVTHKLRSLILDQPEAKDTPEPVEPKTPQSIATKSSRQPTNAVAVGSPTLFKGRSASHRRMIWGF